MGNLLDKEASRELERKERRKVITVPGIKDKVMTIKINSQLYAQFTQINKAYGLTNSSAANMIIADYVQSKKSILEEC